MLQDVSHELELLAAGRRSDLEAAPGTSDESTHSAAASADTEMTR